MSIYFEHDDIVLFHGENPSQLLELPDNFVDTTITDPPYGLSFMGKKWDYDVPCIEIWKECLRVLKPGGTALIFAGSRTQHRMAVNVEDAGFILKDCIMWIYGSGFPKATDLSLQFDKKACQDQLVKKLGRKPDKKEFDDAWKVFREVVRIRTDGRGASPQKINNHGQGDTGIGHADGSKQQYHETAPNTPEAILWSGWKSHGLKPAYEPILVAMKPNEGTYANNALVHGVSGLNINGSKIGTTEISQHGRTKDDFGFTSREVAGRTWQGRFPANIILSCTCGDVEPWEEWIDRTKESGGTWREWESLKTSHELDCPVRMLDEQSGVIKTGTWCTTDKMRPFSNQGEPTNYKREKRPIEQPHGASRFFYCAKASKRERNAGCEGLKAKFSPTIGDGIGNKEHNPETATKKHNNHPTVKPLALMKYLCTLTKTPTGGTILDPFMGSGTTGVAAKILGRPFIGIDQDENSCVIAKARIIHAG